MELPGFGVECWCWSYVSNMLSKEQVLCLRWCNAGKKDKKLENYLD